MNGRGLQLPRGEVLSMSVCIRAKEIATRNLFIEFPISLFSNHTFLKFLQRALTREH